MRLLRVPVDDPGNSGGDGTLHQESHHISTGLSMDSLIGPTASGHLDERQDSSGWLMEHPVASEAEGHIVRQIASFLSLSDAASLVSMDRKGSESNLGRTIGPVESWASFVSMNTPETPGLMALSPDGFDDEDDYGWNDRETRQRLQDRQSKWLKQKLSAAVFAHPQSLRSYCLEAHQAAYNIHKSREEAPETLREPSNLRLDLLKFFCDVLFRNVPLSVALDLVGAVHETALDTSFAAMTITFRSINGIISAIIRLIRTIWDRITHFDPLSVLDAFMGRTSEALASGIQSVTTGVGSASTAALHRLSRGGDAHGNSFRGGASSASLVNDLRNDIHNQKVGSSFLNARKYVSLHFCNSAVAQTEQCKLGGRGDFLSRATGRGFVQKCKKESSTNDALRCLPSAIRRNSSGSTQEEFGILQ